MLVLPLWAACLIVALFILLSFLAYHRMQQEWLVHVLAAATLISIGVGVFLVFLQNSLSAERRSLDMRAQELLMRAAMPNSPLACLDAYVGDVVESSCEKWLFATPESVAAAMSYVVAQLSLLSDFTDHAQRTRSGELLAIVNLRRAIERDRFGLVAQALIMREGCTSNECAALSIFYDPSRIQSNLVGRTFDFISAHYVTNWTAGATAQPAVATASTPNVTTGSGRTPRTELFFPSASSIPAVSIMNAEPVLTAQPLTDARPSKQTSGSTTHSTSARASRDSSASPR
jgi:hypothetical protein